MFMVGANFIDLNSKYNKNISSKQQWSGKWKNGSPSERGKMIKDFARYIGRIDGTAIDESCTEHSLFGKFLDDKTAIEDMSMIKVRHHVGEIAEKGVEMFNTVISLKEDEAIRSGFTDRQTWKNMVNKKIIDIAKEYGIESSKVEYIASVHSEEGHIHCHLVFWKENEAEDGRISKKKNWNNVRKSLNKEIFQKELDINYKLQNEGKKNVGEEAKKFLDSELRNSIKELTPELYTKYFNNKISPESLKVLQEMITNITQEQKRLSKENKSKIRYVYKYQAPEIKELLLKAAREVIKSNTACNKEFISYVNATVEISKILGNIGYKNPVSAVKEKAEEDMLIKIANNILTFVKEEKIDESQLKKEEYEKRHQVFLENMEKFAAIRKEKEVDYEKNIIANKVRQLCNDSYKTCQDQNISQCASLKKLINYANLTKQAKKELALKNKFKGIIDWER